MVANAKVDRRQRRSRRQRLSARYVRLRHELDLPARMAADELVDAFAPVAELRTRYSRYYDYDEGDWWEDEHERRQAERRDAAYLRFFQRLDATVTFNPVIVRARPQRGEVSTRRPAAELEARIVEHLSRIREIGDAAIIVDDYDDELFEAELAVLREAVEDGGLILTLALFRRFWLRSPLTWAPGTELIEHLFVAYDYPLFLFNAWRAPTELPWIAMMIVASQGGSVRRLTQLARERGCPGRWPALAKKLPGSLAAVPARLSPAHGLMYAEVIRLGGSALEFKRLRRDQSYLLDLAGRNGGDEGDEQKFWRGCVAWLIRHRDALDDRGCAEILAWARHEQIERHRLGEEFRWAGRAPAAALREAREYAAARYRATRSPRWARWPELGIDWSEEIDGTEWTITELCTGAALSHETQRMRHCVWMYALKCAMRQCAIVSVAQAGAACLTIELSLPSRQIVQVRGLANRRATAAELAVIERWRSARLPGSGPILSE